MAKKVYVKSKIGDDYWAAPMSGAVNGIKNAHIYCIDDPHIREIIRNQDHPYSGWTIVDADPDALTDSERTVGAGVLNAGGKSGDVPEFVPAPDTKNGNPKDLIGSRKARWFSYIPLQVLVGVGLALMEGAIKYGRHNYRKAGVRASIYVDACVCGHLTPWLEGEDIDPVSGLNHIDKAIAGLIVLRDGMLQGNWVDDRPIRAKGYDSKEADRLAAEIIARFPDAKKPFTEKDFSS